jgi:hypothetical protein
MYATQNYSNNYFCTFNENGRIINNAARSIEGLKLVSEQFINELHGSYMVANGYQLVGAFWKKG